MRYIYNLLFMHIRSYVGYGQKIGDIVTRALFLMFFSALTTIVVLYVFKAMWTFYLETFIGQKFLAEYPTQSLWLSDTAARISPLFAARLTLIAFYVCLSVAAVCQFFSIARYLYYPRDWLGRLLTWGFPLGFAVAWEYKRTFGLESWTIAYLLVVVPTLCVFAPCFKFTAELIPELGDILRAIVHRAKTLGKRIYAKVLLTAKDHT